MAQLNGHIMQSSNSIESSYTSKSNASKLNGSVQHSGARKLPNVNLISSHTGTFSDPSMSSGQEFQFYNPRQNGVARKYWQEKQTEQAAESTQGDEKPMIVGIVHKL